jgi:hypothetical protein
MSRQEFLNSKRERVAGSGPSRDLLPNYYKVGLISDELSRSLIELYENHQDVNDIYGKDYSVSKHCDLASMLPKQHSNILLQKPKMGSDGMNEKDYNEFSDLAGINQVRDFLESEFPGCYRARIACLAPFSKIDWHIDMNTKVSCRFHILLENSNFIFEVDRRGVLERLPLVEKDIFFTNTAFKHRVENPTSKRRLSLIFDIEYESLTKNLPTITTK